MSRFGFSSTENREHGKSEEARALKKCRKGEVRRAERDAEKHTGGNVRGGMGKGGKEKKRRGTKERNLWVLDEGFGTRSSAEEQFEAIDKEMIMAKHREEMGIKYIDMLVDMDMKDIETMLMKFRENMTGVTDAKDDGRVRVRCGW